MDSIGDDSNSKDCQLSLKKRNSTGSRSLHIINDCSSEGNYFAQTYQKKSSYEQSYFGILLTS